MNKFYDLSQLGYEPKAWRVWPKSYIWSNKEIRLGLFQCRYPDCLSYLRISKLQYLLVNDILQDHPTCSDPACGRGMFKIYTFRRRIGIIERISGWVSDFFKGKPFFVRKQKLKVKSKDLFDIFSEQDLYKWIKPGEFSFGPSGQKETLQPGPISTRNNNKDFDISKETQITRYNLAISRKEAGLPALFWMPFNQDKIPEELKHLCEE